MDYQDSTSLIKPSSTFVGNFSNVTQPTLPNISFGSFNHNTYFQRETEIVADHRFFDQRMKTFERWPKSITITPHELCGAGFIYTGYGDMVKCVFCQGKLSQFETTDIPIVEHSKHFPQCEFVRTMMPTNPTEIKKVSLINIAGCKKLIETACVWYKNW